MAQEVQTTLDYRAELNEIQWIWYQQRRISDKMQVREKETNRLIASWSASVVQDEEKFVTAWTTSIRGNVAYIVSWGTIRIPLGWAYIVYITPVNWYTQNLYYTMRIYSGNKQMYSLRTDLADKETRIEAFNFGRGDELTVSFTSEFSYSIGLGVKLEFVKL